MNKCPYCEGKPVQKEKMVDLLQGYYSIEYWYECLKCGSKTKKTEMLDIENSKNDANEVLKEKLKKLEDDWNNGKVKRNEKYFNVTITREEYERLVANETK